MERNSIAKDKERPRKTIDETIKKI